MDRRSFLARLRWLLAYPLLAAHHRPSHAGGPKPTVDVGWGAVYWAALSAPAAETPLAGVFDPAIFDPQVFDTGAAA